VRSPVESRCSDRCAGRAPGTPGGREARSLVVNALRDAGLDPDEQEVPGCKGANVIASLPGEIDCSVVVGAHFDPLGSALGAIYRGADDNAAAVASWSTSPWLSFARADPEVRRSSSGAGRATMPRHCGR
jgi:hypothetical protein